MAALEGVVLSRVGYSGGLLHGPTYKLVCNDGLYSDWSESIQVEYDPSVVSYSDVLDAFFRGHDANSRGRSRQYGSFIFAHDEKQLELAHVALADRPRANTIIEPFRSFWDAEAYHQKWLLQRRSSLFRPLQLSEPEELLTSRAATLLNAFAAQRLTGDAARERLLALDLTPEIEDRLLRAVRSFQDEMIVFRSRI